VRSDARVGVLLQLALALTRGLLSKPLTRLCTFSPEVVRLLADSGPN